MSASDSSAIVNRLRRIEGQVRGVAQTRIAGKYTQYRKERRAGKPDCFA